MKSRKRTGPKWLPWGTPELALNLLENDETILATRNLFIKYEDIQEWICDLNPNIHGHKYRIFK